MKLLIGDIERVEMDLSKTGNTNPTDEQIAMGFVRNHRTSLIQDCDWMAGSDVTMTNEWKVYRQSLRNLPADSTPDLDSDGNLTGVDWPAKPE
jgi:hypothetical protein